MTNEEKEKLINELLIFMNNKLEDKGADLNRSSFDLSKGGEDSTDFLSIHDIGYDSFEKVIKTCITRQYIKNLAVTRFDRLFLTLSGQGRAISVMNSDKPSVSSGSNIVDSRDKINRIPVNF